MSDAPLPLADAGLERPPVAPWRLVVTLAVAGALAGLLLVFVDGATRERIEENRRRAVREAVQEVLGEPARVRSLRVTPEGLVPDEETSYQVDAESLDRVFAGYAAATDDRATGFAIVYQRTGFQDVIRLAFGYDPAQQTILGVRVLESKETPGLGDRIEHDEFLGPFRGRAVPLIPVKPGAGSRGPADVDTITGATISSTWVVKIINQALERVGSDIDAWREKEGR